MAGLYRSPLHHTLTCRETRVAGGGPTGEAHHRPSTTPSSPGPLAAPATGSPLRPAARPPPPALRVHKFCGGGVLIIAAPRARFFPKETQDMALPARPCPEDRRAKVHFGLQRPATEGPT